MHSAFTYVLPCNGEAIIKIGFSREPMRRFETFHPRYFEIFDIDEAFLVESESVRDARNLETLLKRGVALHNAPQPLTVNAAAGGITEWYRGAYAVVRESASRYAAEMGLVVHAPLRQWLQHKLAGHAPTLYEWSAAAQAVMAAEFLDTRNDEGARRFRRRIQDRLDAFAAVGIDIDAHLAPGFQDMLSRGLAFSMDAGVERLEGQSKPG